MPGKRPAARLRGSFRAGNMRGCTMRTAQSLEEYYAASLWRNRLEVQREKVEKARASFHASTGAEKVASYRTLRYELSKLRLKTSHGEYCTEGI